jgi:hypothetical protein
MARARRRAPQHMLDKLIDGQGLAQRDKRDLAEAIVSAQNSLIRTLTRDDLELLLS